MSEETDAHCDESDNHLGWGRIDTTYLYKKFQAEIVYQQIDYHNQDISPKLLISAQRRLRESNILIQPKTRKQRNWKHNQQCHHVRSKTYFKGKRQTYIN